MNLCSKCKKNERRSNASGGHYCKSCHNEACKRSNKKPEQRKRISVAAKARRYVLRTYIISKKSSIPCADCGIIYPHFVMDHDHVRGAKSGLISLAALRHWSFKKLDEELAKCDLVCANCHRIRTFTRATSLTDKIFGFEPKD